MAAKTIDAGQLKHIFLAGAQRLEANKEWINELNVFPVPDGDTGTNMTLTIMSAVNEVQALASPDMESLAKAISSGSLRGARGNSGVILSQLLRGFTKEIKKASLLNAAVIAAAFQRASETAYKAVMKPKEGTILTVAKCMADKAAELAAQTDDLESIFAAVIEHGDYVLSQTPEMLPVLKEAGVVDSGGQGLMVVMKGCMDAFLGKEVDLSSIPAAAPKSGQPEPVPTSTEEFDIKYGYCTEFMIHIDDTYDMDRERGFKAYLESIGDSIVVVSDDEIVKVHVHTNDPGLAIQKALTFGPLSRMKIDNMREEHQEKLIREASRKAAGEAAAKAAGEQPAKEKDLPRKEAGFVAISAGDGMSEIFKGLGVDTLIEGGQTMNPSTEDILNAVGQVHADVVYVLPNNKNIILAAEQAMHLTEDKQVVVVPSRTIPQGITALISYMPGVSPDENLKTMKEEMSHVKTGQVTYAVRNTSLDGVEVHEGDVMGIDDHAILAVGRDVGETSFSLLKALVDEESELISLYYGSEVEKEDAELLFEKAQEAFPDRDIELHYGGQPIYYYVMSVE